MREFAKQQIRHIDWNGPSRYEKNIDLFLMTYTNLEDETNLSLQILKREVKELRNMGLIELLPGVNDEGALCGSGYELTDKGSQLVVDRFSDSIE